MKVKDGVELKDLNIVMRPALMAADKIWSKHGRELVITSTGDGVHSPASLHPYGYAFDCRTRYFGAEQILEVARELREALPAGFQVIVEKSHIHVEFDDILSERLA